MRTLSANEEAELRLIALLASHLSSADHRSSQGAIHAQDGTMTFDQENRHLQLVAQAEYEARGVRASFFDDGLFGEPAWDILLDLYIQQTQSRRTSVTSACIAARVPASTALRWIGQLHDAGLISRQRDTEDCRRWFLELTAKGFVKMEAYLKRRGKIDGLVYHPFRGQADRKTLHLT